MTTLTASSRLTDGCDVAMANAIDRLIRISTAVAVLAVASVAAYVSYWHAYAVVRTHVESGLTARLEPATIDGLVYASSMVILYAARHGSPVPRLARWLLELHDRTDGPIMSVTQETLSQLLGVRRTTVTQMVAKLRAAGAIRSDRRGLIEIDRARLEEATCECYRIMRRETDRIVPDEAVTPRLHFPSAADLKVDDCFE